MGDRGGWVGKSACCPSARTRVLIPINHVKGRSLETIVWVHIPSIPTMRQEAETGESREACRPPSLAYTGLNKRSYPKQGERWDPTSQGVLPSPQVPLYLHIWTQGHAWHTIIPKDKKEVTTWTIFHVLCSDQGPCIAHQVTLSCNTLYFPTHTAVNLALIQRMANHLT